MINKKEYYAQVVDNNDSQKKGRIKIRVPELHWGIIDTDLPYAKQDKEFSSFIPEIGEVIVVYSVDRFYKKWFYQSNISLEEKHEHNDFENNVKSKIGSTSQYPNTKYLRFKNGATIAFDSSLGNPEISLYSPKESWVFIDKDGKVKIKASSDIEILTEGKISLKSSSADLKMILTDLLNALIAMQTMGSPALHTVHPQTITKFNTVLSDISNLLK